MKNKLQRTAAAAMAAVLLFGTAGAAHVLAVDPSAPLPIEVIADAENRELRKVYELPKTVDPATIPVEDIARGGVVYECVDVLRAEIAQEDTKPYEEIFETEAKSNDDATVAASVPVTRMVETEDGYAGELTLVPDSIIATVKGYGSSKDTKTAIRTYPGLSDMDTSQVAKTIQEGGRTLSLTDVKWQTSSPSNPDDPELEASYTAVAYYSVEVTSSYATGYTITAKYVGNITRSRDALLRYTVIFAVKSAAEATLTDDGASVVSPTAAPSPSSAGNGADGGSSGSLLAGVLIGVVAAILIAGVVYIIIKKPISFSMNRTAAAPKSRERDEGRTARDVGEVVEREAGAAKRSYPGLDD